MSPARWTALALSFAVLAPRGAGAFDGVALEEPWKPGKIDVHFDRIPSSRADATTERTNVFWWSPVLKAGGGVLDDAGARTKYAGGFFRALMGARKLELIGGAGFVDRPGAEDAELQLELRLPGGLGLGGGGVDVEGDAGDIRFAKAAHRGRLGAWRSILVFQLQEVGDETSPGGYVGFWEDRFMAVLGHDGEQRQGTVALLAPPCGNSSWRPVLEGIYIDQGVGDVPGPEIIFVNGTLGFREGFLSHPARLGRAMGPTGLEFANPLGFLWGNGPWNRRLDPWELGGLGNFRLFRVERPNGVTTAAWEAVLFPLQFDRRAHVMDGLFVGLAYRTATGVDDDPGPLAGWIGKAGFLRLAAAVEVGLESEDVRATFGVIDPF